MQEDSHTLSIIQIDKHCTVSQGAVLVEHYKWTPITPSSSTIRGVLLVMNNNIVNLAV